MSRRPASDALLWALEHDDEEILEVLDPGYHIPRNRKCGCGATLEEPKRYV